MEITPEISNTIEQAVINALNRGAADKKYIDIGRIPFICDDIRAIKEMMSTDSKTTQWTVKMIWLAMGGVGVLTVLVIPLILALVGSGKL